MQSVVIHNVQETTVLKDGTVKLRCNLLEGIATELTIVPKACNQIAKEGAIFNEANKEQSNA